MSVDDFVGLVQYEGRICQGQRVKGSENSVGWVIEKVLSWGREWGVRE